MSRSEIDASVAGAVRLHLACLAPAQRERAVDVAGGIGRLARTPSSLLVSALGDEAALRLLGVSSSDAQAEIDRSQRLGIEVVTRAHPSWPPLLREIPDPPWALWVRGTLPDPALPCLSIVGARRTSPYGLTVTRELASACASAGAVIVSGGARGVDGAAHDAALEARAPTVAVLGCGVDVAYPREHRRLFARIAEAGAVVSEHPCGVEPRPYHFPVRNRLLAGWSPAVLVTEASLQSGSLITARLALDAGRDVLAVPGPVTSPLSAGTNALIAEGARLVQGATDILEGLFPGRPMESGRGDRRLADEADPLLRSLPRGEAVDLDWLAVTTAQPPGDLLARLVLLESSGLVEALPGGLWLRRRSGASARGRE